MKTKIKELSKDCRAEMDIHGNITIQDDILTEEIKLTRKEAVNLMYFLCQELSMPPSDY